MSIFQIFRNIFSVDKHLLYACARKILVDETQRRLQKVEQKTRTHFQEKSFLPQRENLISLVNPLVGDFLNRKFSKSAPKREKSLLEL